MRKRKRPQARSAGRAGRPAPVAGVTERPRDGLWLWGTHPVLAAVANPRRRCRRILAIAPASAIVSNRLSRLGPEASPRPAIEVCERHEIERHLPRGAVHQGLALLCEPLAEPGLEEVLEGMAAAAPILVLDQPTDPHNVGAVLRSALAFGAAAVVLPRDGAPGETGALAKAAAGALERVPLIRVVNLARALRALKDAGFWCVGFDPKGAIALTEADLSGRIALVLGSEGEGLRRLTRDLCDHLVRIPVAPEVESLNLSVSAAIALYELARRKAGPPPGP